MQNFPTVEENIIKYRDAGFPILYIYTYEEEKADRYISEAAEGRKILEWNGANGLVSFETKAELVPAKSLEEALSTLSRARALDYHFLVIKDAAGQLESPKVIALLKEIARKIRKKENGIDATIFIISPTLNIPKELEKLITILELSALSDNEVLTIVRRFVEEYSINVSDDFLEEMMTAFKGLSESEIEDLLSLASVSSGDLTKNSLPFIFNQKKQMILKSGILEMIKVQESIDDIGGLENLKEWLKRKATVFKDAKAAKEFGVPTPKGVLIAGVAGCGKSLTAKAAGNLFDVPLLRLDMGRLMGKYVGESEENMRKAINLVEAISPCVLWVDELEKAFAGIGGGGSEVTTRLFGAFLTWMQEKTAHAFVVATANDISKLPPELLRKGRFDEIFYVSLPNPEERRRIFEIHLNKRRKNDVEGINISELVSNTDGYSGADIESVVGESVESAFVKKAEKLTTEQIISCIKNTHSLSEIMEEQIKALQDTYEKNKFKKASK